MTMADGPQGVRKQEGAGDQLGLNASLPATCFPTAAAMANSWNPKLGEEMGRCALRSRQLTYKYLIPSVIAGEMYKRPWKVPDIFSRQYRVQRAGRGGADGNKGCCRLWY